MVRKICTQENDWRYYKVQVKCGKESFKAAEKYIKSRNNTESGKTECLTTEINENKSVTNRNTRSSNQSTSPAPTTKKHHTDKPILRNNRSDPIKLSIKRPMPNISYKDLFKKRTKTVKTSELMSETPNHSNESGNFFNENKLASLDLDCLNQEQHNTTDVNMSMVVSNTVEKTVLESNTENESSSIPASQFCQPLMDNDKQNLPTVIIDSPNEQSKESDVRKNYKLNTIDERPVFRNSSTSGAAEHSTESERKSGMPSKHAHPIIIKQMQLAQRSNEMYGIDLDGRPPINTTNTPAQNSTDQFRCLSNQSHQRQSPEGYTDSLHHNLQSQNLPKPSSAKIRILEEKIIVSSYSKAANPSLEISNTSYNSNFFNVNEPILYYDQHQRKISIEKSSNANDNDQQMCPNISTITSPSALYRLRDMAAQFNSHLPSHVHNEQLLPIKEMDVCQDPRTQEIFHRSAGVNPIHQSAQSQSATHQEPCTQEILDRPSDVNPIEERACSQSATHPEARTQIAIDKSTEVNPVKQSDSSQSTTRKELNTSERKAYNPIKVIPISMKNPPCSEKKLRFGVRKPHKFPKLLYEEGFSPVHENHSKENVSLQNTNSEKSIKIDDVDQNSQHPEIRQNTPSTVQNTSSSPNRSSCLWNDSSEKQISQVTQDHSISEPRRQERRIGKSSKLNHTEKSIYFKNNTETESFSVQNTPSKNQLIKKSCTKNLSLAYEHDTQEKSEDFVDQEMSTKEITVENTTESYHIETTEINTEKESKVPDLSASFNSSPEVKSIVEECLLKVFKNIVKQMKLPVNCDCNNTSGQFNESIEKMVKSIDRYFDELKNNIAEPVSQKPPLKPEGKSANNKNKKSNNVELNYVADDSDDDGDVSNDNDSDVDNKDKYDTNENDDGYYEPPKKKRGSKRSFVLPPEYDAHNTRWTLKYHAIEPGVVELTPHSKIYISSLKLANCKRVAKDYRTFGRMLLREIFSQNALSVCSLTGAKANAFDVHESDIRPGLDKEARSILLTYVEKYGRKKGWGTFDTNSVVNSLRSKIQEMRAKYGSSV